jgi:hypothetical protein
MTLLATRQPLFFERAFYIGGVGGVSSRIFAAESPGPAAPSFLHGKVSYSQPLAAWMTLDLSSEALPQHSKTGAAFDRRILPDDRFRGKVQSR